MDDISLMDTTSDDELDFSTPLWKRINRRQDSALGSPRDGKDLLFAKPFFEETHDRLKKGLKTSGACGTSEGSACGERGSPLSEVTSNISWGPLSPTFPGKPTVDKVNPFARTSDCKTGSPGTSRAESFRTPYQEESTKNPVSEKGKHVKTKLTSPNHVSGWLQTLEGNVSKEPQSEISGKFAKDGPDTSRRLPLPPDASSTLPSSPSKGGWKKIHVSPSETSKKLLNLPVSPWRHTGKVSPKHTSPGSSVHIHWDKNKQMQSTSLEPQCSSRNSPNKLQTHFSPRSSFSIRSPILIPDTPDLESRDKKHVGDDINNRSSFEKSQLDHSGKRDRYNVLLNDLLSEDDDFESSQDLPSASSGRNLFSSRSPSSSHDVKSSKRILHTPTKKVKDVWMQKLKSSDSSERKETRQRDPVWDFADKFSSQEKHSHNSSRNFDHRRAGAGAKSKDNNYFNKVISPEKDFGRKNRQYMSSTASEDDDLPLISYITNKNKHSACDKSPADPTKHKHDPLATSPSRTWTSPPKRSSWASPKHSKKPSVIISPWRPQPGVSNRISSRKDTWNKDGQTAEGTSRSSSMSGESHDKDGMTQRRAAVGNDDSGRRKDRGKFTSAMTKKKKLMTSLFADFSSDEEEGSHLSEDKKRKNNNNAHGLESAEERTKRRKINFSSASENFDGSSNIRDRQKVGHSTDSYSSGRMKDSKHLSSNSNKSSSVTKSLSYPSQSSASTTSSKANPSLSTKTSSQSSDEELVHSSYSKGNGEKREKGPSGPTRKEDHWKSSSKLHSSIASDIPSSSGISGGTLNTVKDDSEDEVVVLDSYAYASTLVGTYGKTRRSHKKNAAKDKKKEARGSSKSSSRSGAAGSLEDERNAVSPSLLQQLNQMESDEAMARRLQEEYDAEMARSVQQHGPSNRSTEDTHHEAESTATHSANDRRVNEPDAGTFANFNPHHNISIEVSDLPVQIGSFNWNYDFQPASSLLDLGRPDRPPPSGSPPPLPRRGRPDHRQRRGGRLRNSDTQMDEDIPDLANLRGRFYEHRGHDMEMLLNLHHDLVPGGRDVRWMPYPYLDDINTPPRPGRQRGRGRARGRGRRRDVVGDQNNGNDYDALLQLADNLGPAVDKRLNQASIDRLPTFKFVKDQHSGSQEENSCPICMDDYEEGAELRRLPCFHGYHKNCIDMWLKKNQDPVCPICRVEVRIE